MIRSIADYLIAVLDGMSDLESIDLILRGAVSLGIVSMQSYPFIEVVISDEDEDPEQPEMTGALFQQVYTGSITVYVQLTEFSGGDHIENVGQTRIRNVQSYDDVQDLMVPIILELQKCDHQSLGDLTVNPASENEVVKQFTVIGPRVYGIRADARTNNWDNFGTIPFEVETIRTRL
jgi:hypothetical protein